MKGEPMEWMVVALVVWYVGTGYLLARWALRRCTISKGLFPVTMLLWPVFLLLLGCAALSYWGGNKRIRK